MDKTTITYCKYRCVKLELNTGCRNISSECENMVSRTLSDDNENITTKSVPVGYKKRIIGNIFLA